MKNSYIGITIGPIYETFSLLQKVAGFWACSYMFSNCSKMLCQKISEKLNEKGIKEYLFLTPHFTKEDSEAEITGVGMYHDQIVIKYDDIDMINQCIEDVKEYMADNIKILFEKDEHEKVKEFVKSHIQIYSVYKEVDIDTNPILEISKCLTALELQRMFNVKENKNYFIEFFKNDNVKNSYLIKNRMKNQILNKNENIKDLKEIVEIRNKKFKTDSYYVMAKGDGDNMGKVLMGLNTVEEIKDFSKKCFDFCSKASKLIQEFGGVVIYAGGDDLLFIAPLVSPDNKNVHTLFKSIGETFNKSFNEYINNKKLEKKPTFSIGAIIRYVKYPLYESFNQVESLMYEAKAKEYVKDTCSNLIIDLRKHSGQSSKIFIPSYENSNLIDVEGILDNIICEYDLNSMNSICKKIEAINKIFKEVDIDSLSENNSNININNLFDNFFSDLHFSVEKVELIKILYAVLKDNLDNNKIENKLISKDNPKKISLLLNLLSSILRYCKFYNEKGGEE